MIDVTAAIDAAFDAERPQEARAYIGASNVGNSCDAAVAFSWRGYPDNKIDARLKRIFRDGHRIEDQVVRDLRKAGIHVMARDPLSGRQWRYTAYGGFVIGHADGLWEQPNGEIIGVEIKSANDGKFKRFQRYGVRTSHPIYYDQMQLMMGMGHLKRFVIIFYNKDSSAYAHEYVDFDEFRFFYLKAKVERILDNNAARVSQDESDWRCRGCFKADACWRGALPDDRNVRTCGNARGRTDGTFECSMCDGQTCTSWRPYQPKDTP